MAAVLDCEQCGRLPMPKTKSWLTRRMKEHARQGHQVWWALYVGEAPAFTPQLHRHAGIGSAMGAR